MGDGDFVGLECGPETIGTLAQQLEGFGVIGCDPEWLVSAICLRALGSDYIASSSTRVLSNGYVARRLAIHRSDEFVRAIDKDVPDISGRLKARNSGVELPPAQVPVAGTLTPVPAGTYSTDVLIRVSDRASRTYRVGCGLLFAFERERLLVATDVGTLAMVLSRDDALIDAYLSRCEAVRAADYITRYG